MLGSYYVMRLLEAAGLPTGVINFIPGIASEISDVLLSSPELGGIHFTGSTGTFQHLWKSVAQNVENYRAYPRLVGETGGKDFIVAHESADPQALAVAIVQGGFEYQGQKCSATSRVYVPDTMWEDVRDRVVAMTGELRMGDPADFRNFLGAVIDRTAFDRIKSYIDYARESEDARILAGGGCDDSRGYFIEPTVVEADDPGHRLMCEEIFGPVVTLHSYRASDWESTLALVDGTSRTRSPARCSRGTRRPSGARARRCGTRRGTTTSTTSRPARSSANSPSEAAARAARTTRLDPC